MTAATTVQSLPPADVVPERQQEPPQRDPVADEQALTVSHGSDSVGEWVHLEGNGLAPCDDEARGRLPVPSRPVRSKAYRSTSPSTISRLPRTPTTSAI